MRALDIDNFADYIAGSAVELDQLWLKPLDAISPMDIQLFYARWGLKGQAEIAHGAISALQSELVIRASKGQISGKQLRLIMHEVPEWRFTADEFVTRLMSVRMARRQAILFALATNSSTEEIVAMEWRSLPAHIPPGIPREILRERVRVRHLRMPYVFWEFATKLIAAPLLKLQEDAEEAFGVPWPSIQSMWSNMIWVSPRTEATELLSIVNEVSTGKL